jgi:hypothetical protein
MLLGAHENVVRSAYAVLELRTHDRRQRHPGVLYLTTERLVFEGPHSRGIVKDLVEGRDVEIFLDEPLGRLRNVTVRRGALGSPRLVVDRPDHRAAFDVLEPDAWVSAIAETRRRAELAVRPPATPGPHGASTVVKVRCRYCGGLGDEGASRCPSCGAPF